MDLVDLLLLKREQKEERSRQAEEEFRRLGVGEEKEMATPQGKIIYREFDWGGQTDYFEGLNGVYYVDPQYIEEFKREHGAL